ncbi:hypothetical protein [Paenibacillus thalictri]|uniref:Uncharacterized protein n=1 Tax=Paenibacillus thalictri TaxID=2527873 RepID=A0A4Q9DY80_9BACL|nr:hypothetical protein [Paenibacillus thalictri]TBL80853.1 hypothetical protein EYB31_06450 [Paenibacillus thalictri]
MNAFVTYLDQFNVLSPNHAKIYDEYTNPADAYTIRISTKIESFLRELFAQAPRSVIMTGNAGDGKTRLCRTVYEHLTTEKLAEWPEEGIVEVPFLHGRIRIVKDLSELTELVILRELTQLQQQIECRHSDNLFYLIAANEGKLTKFLSQHPSLQMLYKQVEQRFMDHETNDTQFHLVNLQDVTSSIYAERIMQEWNKEEYWQACQMCSKQKRCIIALNHRKLAQEQVKRNLVEQYRLVDCLGIHVTMREILIHLSYVITGGLTCSDIQNADRDEVQRQAGLAYYDNFYGVQMPDISSGEMGAVRHFRQLDPGQVSISSLDDFLLNGDLSEEKQVADSHARIFDDEIDLLQGYYRKIIELYRTHNPNIEPERIFENMPKFRRKYYFEYDEGLRGTRQALLPYQHFSRFIHCLMSRQEQMNVRRELVQGLNNTFAKKLVSRSERSLYAVSENLLIHQDFAQSQLKLSVDQVREDIDYAPSRLMLTIEDIRFEIKLPVFEYLLRVASGGLFITLKQEVDILLNTFKNDLISQSELNDCSLQILAMDHRRGVYVPHQIEI